MSRANSIVVLLSVLLIGACAPPIVNIPPLQRDVAFHSPNHRNVIAVQAVALGHVIRRYPPVGDVYAIELPAGTIPESYERVAARLPEGLSTDAPLGEGLPTYRIAQVSIYGTQARVDVTTPAQRGTEQLVSVFQSIDLSGWYATHSRLWNIPVDEALRILRQPTDLPAEETGQEWYEEEVE